MQTLGENPRLTLLKIVFEKPPEQVTEYLLEYLEDQEQQEISKITSEIKMLKYSLFEDIKGFKELPPDRKKTL